MRLIIRTLLLLVWAGMPVASAQAEELAIIARPGNWPVADRLIPFQNRIWFATAVKGVDHNSADIWSFDPASDELRFEHFLFSQDAGHPAVHDSLLYWPHEDMRIGLGMGAVSVTNGRDWQNLFLPSNSYMMHTHAVTSWNDRLVAAMAGWNSVLAASSDGGKSWQQLIDAPPSTGSFHRYNNVVSLDERLFVRHWQDTGTTLKEFRDGELHPVKGWPRNRHFSQLTVFQNALYALVDSNENTTELWRLDSDGAQQTAHDPAAFNPQLLTTDGDALWAVTYQAGRGQLWSSTGGNRFTAHSTFTGGVPYSVAALAPGKIYVGGEGADGRAILWGPDSPMPKPTAILVDLPKRAEHAPWTDEFRTRAQRLRVLLGNEQTYGERNILRAELEDILQQNPPPDFFTPMLDVEAPKLTLGLFGGRLQVPAQDFARWHILGAMGRNGERNIPLELLEPDWNQPSNRPQKWFDPLLIAIEAIHLSGQNDRATIDALIRRLDKPQEPAWLQSQVTGTLAAVTGAGFAQDKAAWKAWWKNSKDEWMPGTF